MVRGPCVDPIPEAEQAPLRRRLKLLRQSLGLSQSSVPGLSTGTVGKYEREDISSVTMAALRKMALAYGIDLPEFFSYLFDQHEQIQENRALIRSMNYLRSMDTDRQKVASDILQALAEYNQNGEKD